MADKHDLDIKRVAILFAGGPAPAANAVISTAAFSFLEEGIQVFGIKHGYSSLAEYSAASPLVEGKDYIRFTHETLTHSRTSRGIMIGTARTNADQRVDLQRTQSLVHAAQGIDQFLILQMSRRRHVFARIGARGTDHDSA
ncbi:MAG: 6-phosphofructokinase, partial [Planctomycetota bacterium]